MTQPYDQIGVRYPWAGGECPVDGNTVVRTWLDRNGVTDPVPAKIVNWKYYKGLVGNIEFFEIVEFAK